MKLWKKKKPEYPKNQECIQNPKSIVLKIPPWRIVTVKINFYEINCCERTSNGCKLPISLLIFSKWIIFYAISILRNWKCMNLTNKITSRFKTNRITSKILKTFLSNISILLLNSNVFSKLTTSVFCIFFHFEKFR